MATPLIVFLVERTPPTPWIRAASCYGCKKTYVEGKLVTNDLPRGGVRKAGSPGLATVWPDGTDGDCLSSDIDDSAGHF
jgi:hypothetical protein